MKAESGGEDYLRRWKMEDESGGRDGSWGVDERQGVA